MLLLIIYSSAIERLICHREMSLIGSTSFNFAQNTMHDFQNTVLNSEWHCLRQMPQKWLATREKGDSDISLNSRLGSAICGD